MIFKQSRFRLLGTALMSVLLLLTGISAHAQGTGLRIMPLGDSITAGYRSTTGNGYRGPLWDALIKQGDSLDFVGSQRSGVMFDPDNEGYYGARIAQIAALIPKELALYQPNVILLHIGSNDLNANEEVATAPNRLASLIDQIIAADPTAVLLVAQIVRDNNADVEARIAAYNAQIPGIVQARAKAGKPVFLVSMDAVTSADLNDGLHPSDIGYQKMAEAWDAGIKQVIAAKRVAPIKFAGKFEIQSVAGGQAIDVSDGSKSNNAAIIEWPYSGQANQMWNFIPTSGGYYQIKNAYSGLDLNVVAASKESGAKIVQWPFGTEGNDQWLPVRNADGSYTFRNRSSGLVLDSPGATTQAAAGAPKTVQLDQQAATGKTEQKFILVAR